MRYKEINEISDLLDAYYNHFGNQFPLYKFMHLPKEKIIEMIKESIRTNSYYSGKTGGTVY